jgi:hypothetical protein
MKKIALLFCVIMLVSCGGDSDSDTNNPAETSNSGSSNTNSVLLRKIEEFESDGTLRFTEVYTYNSDNFIKKTVITYVNSPTRTDLYIYENGKITKKIITRDNGETSTQEYFYDNGLIVLMEANEDMNTYYTKFTYNSQGYFTTRIEGTVNSGDEDVFTYNSSNQIVKEKTKYFISEYEYDNKTNYFKPFITEAYYKMDRHSDNNMTKLISSSQFSSGTNTIATYTFEYKYNSDGLPIEIIEKKDDVIKSVIKLTYN